MERKEFLKSACTLGLCSCAGFSILSGGNIFAGTDETLQDKPDWRIGFIQKRFAKLLEILDSYVDEDDKLKMLENMGRQCARENSDLYMKFKGNPEGFLAEVKKKWADEAEYNPEDGSIRIVGKKSETCGCPFVDNSLTPKEFCNCSLGWNLEVYETVLDKKVEVKIEQSSLWGDGRCTAAIKII